MIREAWQVVRDEADINHHSQDPAELSASLKLIYLIAQSVLLGSTEGLIEKEVAND